MFLLTPDVQLLLIRKVSRALNGGGRFLFTAPQQECEWSDALTGRKSVCLGFEAYRRILASEGLALVGERLDEGENHYYLASKEPNEAGVLDGGISPLSPYRAPAAFDAQEWLR